VPLCLSASAAAPKLISQIKEELEREREREIEREIYVIE
jgi:hypothetical protein